MLRQSSGVLPEAVLFLFLSFFGFGQTFLTKSFQLRVATCQGETCTSEQPATPPRLTSLLPTHLPAFQPTLAFEQASSPPQEMLETAVPHAPGGLL